MKPDSLASIPNKHNQIMPIGYWAQTAYYSKGIGDKAAGALNWKPTTN